MNIENERAAKIFEDLPTKFQRKEVIAKAIKEGFSERHFDNLLNRGIVLGTLRKVERGVYEKI